MDLAFLIIAVWIMSTCFHEFGHAITAYWGGDKSVKDRGYLTLNPLVYINSATTLVLPVIFLIIGGIALPGAAVVINTGRIKSRFMQSLVSLAGPLFTLIFVIGLVAVSWTLPALKGTMNAHLYTVLTQGLSCLIYIHFFVFILNLLPLPPLDGWGILEPWMPTAVKMKAREFGNIGWLILMGLFFFVPFFSRAIQVAAVVGSMVVGVNLQYVDDGFDTLKANSYQMLAVLVVAWIAKSKMGGADDKAQKLIGERKFDEALAIYKQQLEKKPDDPRLLVAAATCHLSLGRNQEALPYAEKAVSVDQENPQANGILAACLSDMGQSERALEAADRAIKSDTSGFYPFTYLVRATSLNQLGRYQESLDAIEEYLKKEKNPGEGILVKASSLEGLGRFDEALATYDKAERSTAANSMLLQISKGILLCALSKHDDALKEFNKFLPTDSAARAEEVGKLKLLLVEKASQLDKSGHADMAEAARQAAATLQ